MRKKLRILEVNKAYYPHVGGIETLVRMYSENLGRNYDADVKVLVCRDGRGKTVRQRINGVDVTRAASLGTLCKCPVSFTFIKLFRKMAKNADVIHIHMPFPLADAAALLSGFKGRVVLSWHSDVVKQKKLMLLYKPFMKWLLNRADAIAIATWGHYFGSDHLTEYFGKCRIVPYGIAPEKYLNIRRNPVLTEKCNDPGSVKIFFTGRLVYYKGVDVLLKAFRMVKGCELFIAGTGDLEPELKKYVHKKGLENKVHFLGFLSDHELKQAYADCDIFVLPSVEKSEAFGIVQLEAMIYGKPVINTRLPSGVPHVSLGGVTGLTVKRSDPKELAEAINTLAENKELREILGKAAAERVRSEFSEKNALDSLYRVLSGKESSII